MFLVGCIGSAYTINTGIDKLKIYMNEEKRNMTSEEELITSKDKVETLKIGTVPWNVNIKIHKSEDENSHVRIKSLYEKGIVKAEIKDSILKVYSDKKNTGYSSLFNATDLTFNLGNKEKLIKSAINNMIYGDVVVNNIFDGYKANNGENKSETNIVDIYVPNNVNIEFEATSRYSHVETYSVDDGVIKDFVTVNDVNSLYRIESNDKIKKLIINAKYSEENNYYADSVNDFLRDLARGNDKSLKIATLQINTTPGIFNIGSEVRKKIADEIIVNVEGEKPSYNDEYGGDTYHEIDTTLEKENDILEKIHDEIEGKVDDLEDTERDSSEYYDEILKGIDKKVEIKKYIELFKPELDRYNRYNTGDSYDINEEYFKNLDFGMIVNQNIADKISINAPGKNVVLTLDNINPEMDIKTKEGIDFRFLLFDNVKLNSIPNDGKEKEYKGNLYNYILSVDKDSKYKKSVNTKPSLVINSNKLKLLEN